MSSLYLAPLSCYDMQTDPIVIVGGGAAGLMAAAFASGQGVPVVLIERTRKGGKKIVIAGGGRCNVLPSHVDERRYVTASSVNTMRRMLRLWPLAEQRAFFEQTLGLPLVLERETGKLFPASQRAQDVRDALYGYVRARGVEVRFDARVVDVQPDAGAWRVAFEGGERLRAAAVVLATGGLSVPNTGSDGDGLRIARRLRHTLHPTYAALTPLTASPARHAPLSGISLAARVYVPAAGFETEGGFLFTHRGYSGPTILDASHHVTQARAAGQPLPAVQVQWTEMDAPAWEALLQHSGGSVAATVRTHLPSRLADALVEEAGLPPGRTHAELRRDERKALVDALARYTLPVTGDEGYKKAEVTGGGVALEEVDPRTCESRRHPGLFLCGEVLDCFGPIGGYNFFWAWATGRAAGLGAKAKTPAVGQTTGV